MTKDQLLNWLNTNKTYMNISAIGRAAKVPNLRNILNGNKNGRGEVLHLSDKHVGPLGKVVMDIRGIANGVNADKAWIDERFTKDYIEQNAEKAAYMEDPYIAIPFFISGAQWAIDEFSKAKK